jgi:hypothetical protein
MVLQVTKKVVRCLYCVFSCAATVEIEQLSKFKAQSEKRFHDGAAIANLKLYTKETYETTDFDGFHKGNTAICC